MNNPIEGGEMIVIMGLECWIPPPPPLDQIRNSHLPKHQQKWKRVPLPDIPTTEIEIVSGEDYATGELIEWEAARREEFIIQTGTDPWLIDRQGNPKNIPGIIPEETYTFPMMEEFRKDQLEKCDPYMHLKKPGTFTGDWIMINGKPIYLTPFHLFYCNWWKLNTGYPFWRWADALRFYHWQYCWEDVQCYGELEASKRGDGKSVRMASKQYLATIYKKNAYSPIQSKTEEDAKKFFKFKIVEPYKDLPDFFIPINSNGTDPQENLRFYARPKAGKSATANRMLQRRAIRSMIDFRNAKENAYDGVDATGIFVREEEGKTERANVNVRHVITKDCVYRDGRMMGKIASSTQVEKWQKGGENYKKLYDHSDPKDRNELGQTLTGLFKMWLPAYMTEFQDEFGFPDEVRAKREQSIKRKTLKRDPEALDQYILQYAWTEGEMFTVGSGTCQYNREILKGREQFVNDPDNTHLVRRGHFFPKDGILGNPIEFEDDELEGRWEVSMLLNQEGQHEKYLENRFLTKTRSQKDQIFPVNNDFFSAGFDPTRSHSNPNKSRSDAGGAILGKFNFWDPGTPNFVADYVYPHPEDPEDAYMEFLYGCMYYGCQFLPESNLGIPSLFEKLGCGEFIMARPESTYPKKNVNPEEEGLPANTQTNDYLLARKKTWMKANAIKLIQPRIIRTSLGFNPAERTKFDLEVATQLAIVAAEKDIVPQEKEKINLGSIMPMYDHSGSVGRIIRRG